MNHPPKFTYCGLTIIVSNPSRFDLDQSELIANTTNAGSWFNQECLRPGVNRWQCDIIDLASFNAAGRRLLLGTRVVLCLGTRAMQAIMRVATTLGEQRGSPVVIDDIVYIASYLPQDSFDPVDFESRLNPLLKDKPAGETNLDEADTEEEDYGTEKTRHGRTARSNWKFWLRNDVRKCVRYIKEGWRIPTEPTYIIYPNSQEVIEVLRSYENTDFHLDIETDADLNITCFGFGFGDDSPIWVVPLLRYNYTTAYGNMGGIMRSVGYASHKNNTVAHNGAGFDYFVIPFKYRLPLGRKLYDTMVAFHRCFPEVEKSLGHGISLLTDLPYHKDEGVFEPQNEEQEQKLWKYNGKDIFGMRELKKGITRFAAQDPGLIASINQANKSIRPYILAALQGIRYDATAMSDRIALNDRWLTQYLRMIRIAVGDDTYKLIQGKSAAGMPGSSKQCVKYFHDMLGYPVVARSKKTRLPKLDETSLLKLKQKHENPVIDIVLDFRGKAKESGSLGFIPYPGIGKLS